RVNNELINKFGNLISRVMGFINRFFDGYIPDIDLNDEEIKEFENFKNYIIEVENYIENFEFRKALFTIILAVDFVNAYIDKVKPWNLIKYDEVSTKRKIYLIVQFIKSITIAFEPFIPFSSKKILNSIGVKNYNWETAKIILESIKNYKISDIGNIYKKVENSEIEEILNILNSRVVKDYITYEEFSKIDLRVGRVISAERIEKSKKLLKLIVSLGTEKRQIVAGIGNEYNPEDLINKNVIIVSNLEPKKIMGIESQGMLLAAGEKPVILTTEKDVEEGSKVK
ncbi:MAG: methionine--tRNA ligase subunit beta, partial [candidate division WOR-3 bacterium]